MSIRRWALTAVAVTMLAGCGTGTPAATDGANATAPGSTSGTPATSAPAGPTLIPVAGGGATDFCSAFQEYRSAVQEDTPAAQGAGYRAAATDLRTFAPPEIQAAALLTAQVIDEVGQAIINGQPAGETLGQGQSPERINALADVSKWLTANCS